VWHLKTQSLTLTSILAENGRIYPYARQQGFSSFKVWLAMLISHVLHQALLYTRYFPRAEIKPVPNHHDKFKPHMWAIGSFKFAVHAAPLGSCEILS
jgi:hypothetical protein